MKRKFVVLAVLTSIAVTLLPSGTSPAAAATSSFGYIPVKDNLNGSGETTLLRYSVELPNSVAPSFPTLLIYQGYSDDPAGSPDFAAPFLEAGYAIIYVTVRGTGCSGGTFDFSQRKEATDGYQVIEWIADQPWSDGDVAMLGTSYSGFTQLYVAATQPPSLDAIVPLSPFSDIYRDLLYPGGIKNTGVATYFQAGPALIQLQAAATGATTRSGGDPICIQNQAGRAFNATSDTNLQSSTHRWDDAFLRERSSIHAADRIEVPVLTLFAWQDEVLGSRGIDFLTRLKAPYHAIVTNGGHNTTERPPYENWVPPVLGFLDHYVRGIDNGFGDTAPVTVWWERMYETGGAPRWTSELGAWPAPQTKPTTFFLSENGALQQQIGTGVPDSYQYVPGTGQSPRYDSYRGFTYDSWRDSPADGHGLAYSTAPLKNDVAVLGSASLDLWLASTAVDTDIQVVLSEVRRENGRTQETYVQTGWLRASHRTEDPALSTETRPYHTHTFDDMELLEPGEPTKMRVEIFPFGHVFRAGSQIRVYIEAPYATDDIWALESLPLPAQNSVLHDVDHPSALVLPVLPGQAAPFEAAPCDMLIRQPCRASTI